MAAGEGKPAKPMSTDSPAPKLSPREWLRAATRRAVREWPTLHSRTAVLNGNIGVGKSTQLAHYAAARGGVVCRGEEFMEDHRDVFELAGRDARFARAFQVEVLKSQRAIAADIRAAHTPTLAERSPIDSLVFIAHNLLRGTLDDFDLRMLELGYAEFGWLPHTFVFLTATPEQSLGRVRTRGRVGEENVDLPFLRQIHELYDILFAELRAAAAPRVVHIDAAESVDAIAAQMRGALDPVLIE